jgi:hypothetical protein
MKERRSHGGPMRRWEDNIKMDCEEIGLDNVGWLRTGTTSGFL